MFAAEFGVGQVLWSFLWFFLFVIWIMILFQVLMDIFRSQDLGGVAKTLWILFVIATPYLGVFVYLIARGHKMAENSMRFAQEQDAAAQAYIRSAAGTSTSAAAELERIADLRQRGVIDDAEYATLKAKVIG